MNTNQDRLNKLPKEKFMKKALTTLIVVAALVAGSVSVAGTGPRPGPYKTTTTVSSLK
jgi:hypothetical protein